LDQTIEILDLRYVFMKTPDPNDLPGDRSGPLVFQVKILSLINQFELFCVNILSQKKFKN
jgi:hypothetical protein